MSAISEPQVILYDLACTKHVCFLPGIWRTRLMLSYKKIPYKTVFLDYPDIEPTLNGLGFLLGQKNPLHIFPAIKHVATKKCIMSSTNVYRFIEATYPDLPLPAFSELGYDIERQINDASCLAFSKLVQPSVHTILPQRTLDAMFRGPSKRGGRIHSAVDMEENADALKDKMCDLMEVLLSHQNNGPFLMGAQPCYTDFLLVGILACAKVVDEDIFKRLAKYPLFGKPYEACLPFMEKKD